jgi:predicted nucleic acid-binding protein
VIVLDSSALIALLDPTEPRHEDLTNVLRADRGPYHVPSGVLGEVAYFAQRRLGPATLDAFLDDLASGAFTVDCGDQDFPRIRELVARYADLPLAFADAAVVACAERTGSTVMALDRDFAVVAREGIITVVP